MGFCVLLKLVEDHLEDQTGIDSDSDGSSYPMSSSTSQASKTSTFPETHMDVLTAASPSPSPSSSAAGSPAPLALRRTTDQSPSSTSTLTFHNLSEADEAPSPSPPLDSGRAVLQINLPSFNWAALGPDQVMGTIFNDLDTQEILCRIDLGRFDRIFEMAIYTTPPRVKQPYELTNSAQKLLDANRNTCKNYDHEVLEQGST